MIIFPLPLQWEYSFLLFGIRLLFFVHPPKLLSQNLEEKLSFMEMDLHDLRDRLLSLEQQHLKTQKLCGRLKAKLLDNPSTLEDGDNPWEEASRL